MLKPQPGLLKKWRLIVVLMALVPAFFNALFFAPGEILWLLFSVCWLLTFLFFYLFYLPMKYRKLGFRLSGEQLIVHSGVFYTRVRTMPLFNIQFASYASSPLDLIWGLSTLLVTAPGGLVRIPGLTAKEARDLAQLLTEYGNKS